MRPDNLLRCLVLLVFLVPVGAAHADATTLVGTWDAKMTVNFTTCPTVTVGDVAAAQLVLRLEGDQIIVETLGNSNVRDTYRGSMTEKGVILYASSWLTLPGQAIKRRGWGSKPTPTPPGDAVKTHEATIEAALGVGTMSGRRIVANTGPCVILYDFAAKKL